MCYMRLGSLLLPALIISGCGGSSSDTPPVEQAPISPASLRPANGSEVTQYLQNGMRLTGSRSTGEAGIDSVSEDSSRAGGFSTTNVHVTGVDEADYVKYDGRRLYVAGVLPSAPEQGSPSRGLRILSTDPVQAQTTLLAELPFESDWGWDTTLYLVSGEARQTRAVAAINTVVPVMPFVPATSIETDVAYGGQPRFKVDLYSVLDPEQPSLEWTLAVDGYLRGSRKIDDMLYIVSEYSPYFYFGGDPAIDPPGGALNTVNREEFTVDVLPDYRVNDGPAKPLVHGETCLIPSDTEMHYGNAWIVNLTTIDLERRSLVDNLCVAAPADGIYADRNTIYLGGSGDGGWGGATSFTAIHRFALGFNGVEYRTTGVVPGRLPWRTANFFMDEHDEDLRVVTTQRDPANADPDHSLFVLRERRDGSKVMDIVGRLPNAAHPQPLGKPGEDLFAVRFFGDRAYAVTFRQIDPLYVIDLNDHEKPVIAGELEIPGFSTYLHPIADSLLFSVGRQVENGSKFKVALFDVADITEPREINSLLFGDPYVTSDALYDLRALSFLQRPDGRIKVTVPVNTYDSHAGLHLFEIDGTGLSEVVLNHRGVINVDQDASGYYLGRDRGVIHEPSVYYIHDARVWSAFWDQPDTVYGPD